MSTDFTIDPADIASEEDVMKNPYQLKSWMRYLASKSDAAPAVRYSIYERALKMLPGSYKLWSAYLRERRAHVRGRMLGSKLWDQANHVHERALIYMSTMPRIWEDYCQFLADQKYVTRTREAFDRALRALPVTQHERIWKAYLAFVQRCGVPELALRVYRRYLKLNRNAIHDYVEYLVAAEQFDEAAKQIAAAIDQMARRPDAAKAAVKAVAAAAADGKTDAASSDVTADAAERALWLKLVDLVAKHAHAVRSVRLEPIVRSALVRFRSDAARLWIALADYAIRLGSLEKARDVFEEALGSVKAVRDFSQIWDAYTRFEDELIAIEMERAGDAAALDLRLARYEALIERQPFLLNSVLLRQNPSDVPEWHKRVALYEARGDMRRVVETYTTALATVEPAAADGKLHSLWIKFAKFYESKPDAAAARDILDRATKVPYVAVDELVAVWCERAELEVRLKQPAVARDLIKGAIASARPASIAARGDAARVSHVVKGLARSVRLWSLYVDLEEHVGTFESTCSAYDEMLRVKVATPQTILNYAAYLEGLQHWEKAFQVFEKGVTTFPFPFARDLWAAYLSKFVARYGGRKLERARDLFEQAIAAAPAADATLFYLQYAALEEKYGLARHAMTIYERATTAVPPADRLRMYVLYIARAADRFGVARTREIFEKAIAALPDAGALALAQRYAAMEVRLGEIDRARALYTHASQLADPRRFPLFWKKWHAFEVQFGNEDTFAEMLRVKRSVQTAHTTTINVAAVEMATTGTSEVDDIGQGASDFLVQVEREAELAREAEAKAVAMAQSSMAAAAAGMATATTVDAADVEGTMDDDELTAPRNKKTKSDASGGGGGGDAADDDADEDADDDTGVAVKEKAIPTTIFGALAPIAANVAAAGAPGAALPTAAAGAGGAAGAKERLMAKRKRD